MLTRQLLFVFLLASLAGPSIVRADEVRYFERDGVTYRETRQTHQRRIPEVAYEERSETVLREQCVTELRDSVRTYLAPVTEYQMRERLVGRWNPLARPYYEYRNVPTVRWECRSDVVQVPTVARQLVPETRTVRTPVTSWRTVEEEVVSRVAVSTAPSSSALASVPSSGALVPVRIPESARRESVGGLSRLESDPPRQGTGTAWRSADDRFRR